jgi:hypothetical protein
MKKFLLALSALAVISLGLSAPALAKPSQHRGYMLRDTTSLPPPPTGKARLVVARDMRIMEDLKPEFVYIDRKPIGLMPQRTVVTAIVSPGWHRVWLGRSSGASVWMEFAADGRYLLRLRETMSGETWQGDLVREGGEGYAEFALNKQMQISVLDSRGKDAMVRHLGKPSNQTQKQDSLALETAMTNAVLPITINEAWYLPVGSDAAPSGWQNEPGKLTLDENSLRYVRADTLVIEIPRDKISSVYFGSERAGVVNPWIKIGYKEADLETGVTFADANLSTATDNYNRIFAELAKHLSH